MKLLKIFLVTAIGSASSSIIAEPIGWQPVTAGSYNFQPRQKSIQWQPITVEIPNLQQKQQQRPLQQQKASSYTSSSGNNYQYDLANPVDRNRYSIDTAAQRRDALNTPDQYRDRSRGEYGGGVRSR
jgi:hypothetical protein